MSKVLLITGAGTGIGAATARLLAPGNRIFVHYHRSRGPAEQVAADVSARGGEAELVQADLSSEAGCRGLVDDVSAQVDALDVLVNNAGDLVERRSVDDLAWAYMERVFALNVFSVLHLSSLCLPLLRAGADPCVVNITSIAARTGAPSATVYGAAKSAVDAFTRGMAREVAPDVRVNAVAPGVIETPFHERHSTRERMDRFSDATPLERNGRAEHVASAVALLVENTFITGETIDVNGGLFMR